MKKVILSLFLTTFVFSVLAQELKTVRINGSECVNGHIIVKFKKDYTDASGLDVLLIRQNLLTKHNAIVKKQWRIGAELWQIDTTQIPQATKAILDSLLSLPYIQYAEPDFIVKADVIPNDPSFGEQWALNNNGQNGGTTDADIDAPEAWDITTGDTNIIVGVIDSGIDYLHPDLAANIWTNWDEIPGNEIDDDNNGYIDDIHGWDFFYNDNNPIDDNGHGTHVSGIIGAIGNNGIGISGVAWKIRMMALKFTCSSGSGATSTAIGAIEYAISNGAKITNNSWGLSDFSQSMYEAINELDSANGLFIAAAGNNSSDNDLTPFYPASFSSDNIISVASSQSNDILSSFSNWGINSVDLAAPGSTIYSTFMNGTYAALNGTSMATPFVSGTTALAWARFPGFTNLQIKDQLLGSVDQLVTLEEKVSTGGRLNAFASASDSSLLPFSVNPRKINFGAVLLGTQTGPSTVTIRNLLNETFQIDSITVDSGLLISKNGSYSSLISAFSILPLQPDSFQVIFHPDSNGTANRCCRIYYKNPNSQVRKVILFLNGFGFTTGTAVPAGEVSGVWTQEGSPYYINGDIFVPESSSLHIQPRVIVKFAGHFSLTIRATAEIFAIGGQSDSITFTSIDTIRGWNGLRIRKSNTIDSLLYCNFLFSRKSQELLYPNFDEYNGGAVFIHELNSNVGSTIISHCSFENNTSRYGSAIGWWGGSGPGTITRLINSCNFYNNHGETSTISSMCNFSKDLFIVNCNFSRNSTHGNGLLDFQSFGNENNYIYKCNFFNNQSQRAIYSWGRNILVANCSFYNNVASSNETTQIKTVENENTSVYFTNINFVNNSNGFIESTSGENKTIQNSIFWNNPVTNFFRFGANANLAKIEYSDIQVATPGEGNLMFDPSFIGPFNFILHDTSECVDAGRNCDVFIDHNTTRNDMGIYGGNGVIIKEHEINFGDAGNTERSDPARYDLEIVNFREESIIFDSLGFQTADFTVSVSSTLPFIVQPYSKKILGLSFSPDSVGLRIDTLSFYSHNLPKYQSKIPVRGNGIQGTTVCGNLCDTLKYIYSPYYLTCDCNVPIDSTLVIEPGVILKISPNKNINIYGMVDVKGNQNDSVLFTCSSDSLYWGKIIMESQPGQGQNPGIISKYTIFEKGRGIHILYGNSNPRNFEYCSFRSNENFFSGFPYGYLFMTSDQNVKIENCIFHDNHTKYLIGSHGETRKILNCLFYENQGKINLGWSNMEIVNSTFFNNNDLIILENTSTLTLKNTIIYNNNDVQVRSESCGNMITVDHCDIKNGIAGIQRIPCDTLNWAFGNISLPPGLNYISGVFVLDSLSPCINGGSDTIGLGLPPADITGHVRIWNNKIDMGAHEYGAPLFNPGVAATNIIQNVTIENSQSTCYNATQTINVAGNGTEFTVQSGGSATMIAGQNILYYPTTTVQSGGYMHGYIAPAGPWCVTPPMPAVAMAEDEIPGSMNQSTFKVYPNPTTGNFILELTGESPADKVSVDIYGVWGEKVISTALNGERKHEFSLSDRPVGVYFIRVVSGDKAETVKIVKQ